MRSVSQAVGACSIFAMQLARRQHNCESKILQRWRGTGSTVTVCVFIYCEFLYVCMSLYVGRIPLSDFPKRTTSELVGLFSTLFFNADCRAGKL